MSRRRLRGAEKWRAQDKGDGREGREKRGVGAGEEGREGEGQEEGRDRAGV